ncbi:hypothetical protein ZWY2020_047115 [Hordeum vulgare]|nr:hypothetical protein ZWY2020_047115 [Hordeum vulgare]
MCCQVVRHKAYMMDMNAAVCSSASSADSVAVVVWFPYKNVVLAADPGSPNWKYPILVMSLGTGFSKRLADSCQIHDNKERIRPSVRPFTIADHLITYCNPREWSKGLMFHEYHYIPQSFEELIKKIRAQKRELRIPHIIVHSR